MLYLVPTQTIPIYPLVSPGRRVYRSCCGDYCSCSYQSLDRELYRQAYEQQLWAQRVEEERRAARLAHARAQAIRRRKTIARQERDAILDLLALAETVMEAIYNDADHDADNDADHNPDNDVDHNVGNETAKATQDTDQVPEPEPSKEPEATTASPAEPAPQPHRIVIPVTGPQSSQPQPEPAQSTQDEESDASGLSMLERLQRSSASPLVEAQEPQSVVEPVPESEWVLEEAAPVA
ncbi:hypothetical protein HDV03_002648 [Kappamyces sp. JEL0829]|nr:hypothetical protein HDV03_002648 [Kappamyces sp. JEL0829]